jgi:hypothetical protein
MNGHIRPFAPIQTDPLPKRDVSLPPAVAAVTAADVRTERDDRASNPGFRHGRPGLDPRVVPAIDAFVFARFQDVDARDNTRVEPRDGHDGGTESHPALAGALAAKRTKQGGGCFNRLIRRGRWS